MRTDMNQWIAKILASPDRKALPIMTYPGLDLIGASVQDLVSSADKQLACMKALGEEFPSVAALTMMDLSAEAEAFGCPVAFSDDDVPTVTAPIIHEAKDVEALAVPAVGAARTKVYLETARLAAGSFTDRPVFAGMIGPYSLTVRLRDMTQVMMDLLMEPETIHALLEKCVSFLIEYAMAFKRNGANGIVIAEPAAGLLSSEHCQEFSSDYVRRIVDAVQDDHFAVILHNCGKTVQLIPSLLSTGARGLHVGNAVDMAEILPRVPSEILVFGNIDPSGLFRSGSPKDLSAATIALLSKTASHPNFVLSSGCDIPPGTPLRNVSAFFEALEDFNTASKSEEIGYTG